MKQMIKPTTICAALMSCFAVQAAEIKGTSSPNAIPNRYIVVFKEQALKSPIGSQKEVATVAREMSVKYGVYVDKTYKYAIKGAALAMDQNQAQALANDPMVAYIEQDQRVKALAIQSNATWGIDRIDQTSLPLSASYTGPLGAGVRVYVLDTGILATHTEFAGRVGYGYPAVDDGKGISDCHGHGTHVAATIGGSTWGVAKKVTIHPVRVLGCDGTGTNSGVIAAMDWVISDNTSPAVANIAFGGSASQVLDDAIARMSQVGVTTVVAAGNETTNACYFSPARAPSAITVGSTTSSDSMSSFSNFGACVDLFAPGSSITSASNTSDTDSTVMSGTSMASAHVAGVAALYLSKNRNAYPSVVTNAILANALNNKITGVPFSKNKFVNMEFLKDPTADSAVTLSNGVPVPVSLLAEEEKAYKIVVPAGKSMVTFVMSGGTGDGDLYSGIGYVPTSKSYTRKSVGLSNAESITFSAPVAGTYYVVVHAYSTIRGATLTARMR